MFLPSSLNLPHLLHQAQTPAPTAPTSPALARCPSPSSPFNKANMKQVDVPTQSGAFGILPACIPTLQMLKPHVVTAHAEDGITTKYFMSSGSVTMNADFSAQLLAEEAKSLDMLDLVGVKSNLEKAHSELSGASDEAAQARIQIQTEANEAMVKVLKS
uniref:ATP synthase F(1) complex subunit delta, mitochondrial n=1 Tax=Vombatus ursinus TaxID=29139 RepID=A0A4X2JWS8_VOMUR